MRRRLRVLDLYCGLGGASEGYRRAGLEVARGVDLRPQPDYPFPFHQGDVLEFLGTLDLFAARAQFDLIHASPPCAAYTAVGKQNAKLGKGKQHPRLTEPTRDWLNRLGIPYVIENPAARPDVVLCGRSHFGLPIFRHRRFELGGWSTEQPYHARHTERVRGWRHGEFYESEVVAIYGSGGGKASLTEAQNAMGIRWSDDLAGITQALPPAYCQLIGTSFIQWKEAQACTDSSA